MIFNNPVFIFARGGSKGIKNKNIKKINGKPLISYTIEFAIKYKIFDKIFISTDNSEIKRIVSKYPVEIIDRPRKYATDNSAEIDAWKHSLNYLQKKKYIFNKMIILPVTSPFKSIIDIKKALKIYNNKTDIVISITETNRHPAFNMVQIKNKYAYLASKIKKKYFNRQQTNPVYDMTTLFYLVNPKFLSKNNHIFEGKVKYVVVPKNRSLDIDDEFDLKIAKLIL